MANRPKIKGTSWESAIVTALREDGFLRTKRKALAGGADEGDIGGISTDICELIIEAKNVRSYNFPAWVDEATTEAHNTMVDFGGSVEVVGVVAAKRNGKGDVRKSIIAMDYETFTRLLKVACFK